VRDLSLIGRRVVVTGAAQGIGYEIARSILESGGDVALLDLSETNLLEAATALRAIAPSASVGHALCDVSDYTQVVAARDLLAERWGVPDSLVNNAGIVENLPAIEVTPAGWSKVLDVNLSGTFYCSQVFGLAMLKQARGNIVNIASMSGIIVNRPQPQVAYNVSKAAVIMLTKSLAAEWADAGIRVNAVAPGYIRTAMTAANLETEVGRTHWIGGTPMGRPGDPEEVADAVRYLLADASSYVTGSTLVIDGGYTVW